MSNPAEMQSFARFLMGITANAPLEWFLPNPPAEPEAAECARHRAELSHAFPLHTDAVRALLWESHLCARAIRLRSVDQKWQIANNSPEAEREAKATEERYRELKGQLVARIEAGEFSALQVDLITADVFLVSTAPQPLPAPPAGFAA